MIIEDQLVRADLIVISGESGDESFDLITSVISKLGEIKVVIPNLAESSKHNYGLIGPEKTPVVTLPGDPVGNYLSAEIFIRPMILKMSGKTDIYRTTKKVKLNKTITSSSGKSRYFRAVINSDDQAVALEDQNSLTSISSSTCLISLNEKAEKVSAGELVEVVIINADKL
jgi:molybdopterin biosynthesis enzyme